MLMHAQYRARRRRHRPPLVALSHIAVTSLRHINSSGTYLFASQHPGARRAALLRIPFCVTGCQGLAALVSRGRAARRARRREAIVERSLPIADHIARRFPHGRSRRPAPFKPFPGTSGACLLRSAQPLPPRIRPRVNLSAREPDQTKERDVATDTTSSASGPARCAERRRGRRRAQSGDHRCQTIRCAPGHW